MARFQFHLGFLSSSPLSHRASVDETEDEVVECECGNDVISSPLIAPAVEEGRDQQFSILATVTAALRKSLVMCSLGAGEEGAGASMDISWPTDVQHIAHVTFDRFDGFLGLPLEFQPDIPSRVPSASASVFGVSAESMQCSHDNKGNSVPTILLSMQRHLYSQGGLKAEGIFRINAENGQEILVREQLNKGIVPRGVDLHCLAGLIKMADPLTALIHAVQVMNFLKTLIIQTLRERENSAAEAKQLDPPDFSKVAEHSSMDLDGGTSGFSAPNANYFGNLFGMEDGSESDANDSFRSFDKGSEVEEGEFISGRCSPSASDLDVLKDGFRRRKSNGDAEGLLNRLNLRKEVQKLCSHPVFQLSRSSEKAGESWAPDFSSP